MKKFNTEKEFVVHVRSLVGGKDDHYMYKNYKEATILLFDLIEQKNDLESLIDHMNAFIKNQGLHRSNFNTTFYSFMKNNPYFFTVFLMGDERLFSEVNGKIVHIFDALELSKEDVYLLFLKIEAKIWNEMFFEYFNFHGMEKETLEVLKTQPNSELVCESIYPRDFKTVFNFYKDNRTMIKKNINSYFKMFYQAGFERDLSIHNWIYKKFSKYISKADTSGFNFDESDWKNSKKNNIDKIDMFESNYSYRCDVISFKAGYRIFRDLAESHPDRVKKALIKHFNSEYKNGKAPKTFTKEYLRVSNYIDINIFELDGKLQSLVLLNKIS
jgi:hypothetical protein